ncbi:MAG: hypothetical protein KY457_11380 [Actinobacteria bacterium]|nr:hypothetical protein [Actinomycetota bacterium]
MASRTTDGAAARVGHRWEALVVWAATTAGARRANVTVAVLLGIGALVTWGGLWLEDRANPPTCYGIGWGCTPDPGTSMFFIGWIVLVPAFGVATVAIHVGRRLAGSTDRRRHVGTAMVILPVAVLAVGLVALIGASLAALPGWLAATSPMAAGTQLRR